MDRFLWRAYHCVVRMSLRNGWSKQDIDRVVRLELVSTGSEILTEADRPARGTDIAALTGLSRGVVARLSDPQVKHLKSAGSRPATAVLAAWHENTAYLDERGKPLVLPTKGPTSFASLVFQYGRDVTPNAILKDLLSAGAVRRLKDGRLRARRRSILPIIPEADYLNDKERGCRTAGAH